MRAERRRRQLLWALSPPVQKKQTSLAFVSSPLIYGGSSRFLITAKADMAVCCPESRQGKARQGKARQGKARQGKARQGKARQGKARQGKARQGKARQLAH
jgi:hypothetical protein